MKFNPLAEFLTAYFFLLVLVYLLLKSYRNYEWRRIKCVLILRVVIIMIMIWILGSCALFVLEPDNSNFHNLLDSHWSMIVYLLSGFEDVKTETTPGRLISVIMVLSGITMVAIVTGELSSSLTKKKLKGDCANMNFKDHVIICNWNSGGAKIIKEIHAEISAPDKPIIIITEEPRPRGVAELIEKDKYVFHHAENLYSGGAFERFNLFHAQSVVILADANNPDPDGKTALITMAVKQTLDKRWENKPEEETPQIRIVAEAVNHQKRELLLGAGVDEVICPKDYGIGVLAQAALTSSISKIYHDLLHFAENTNEIYIWDQREIPKEVWKGIFEGKSFVRASHLVSQAKTKKNPLILIGVRRDGGLLINPQNVKDSTHHYFDIFQKGDSPVFLAYVKPTARCLDLSAVRKSLAKGE